MPVFSLCQDSWSYFAEEQRAIDDFTTTMEGQQSQKNELVKEQSGKDGAFAAMEKINKGSVHASLKELTDDSDAVEEQKILRQYING